MFFTDACHARWNIARVTLNQIKKLTMKAYNKILTLLVLIVFFTACKKESPVVPVTQLTGTWTISSFVQQTADITSSFSAYTITFNSNGEMRVYDSMNTYMGSWNQNNNMMNFNTGMMGLPDSSPMHNLEGDWEIYYQTDSLCKFRNNSMMNNSTMFLKRM